MEKILWPLSSRGGGGKALGAGPLKKYRFFALSLIRMLRPSVEYVVVPYFDLSWYVFALPDALIEAQSDCFYY